MNIIVDAFGGDNAPLEMIKASIKAVDEYKISVTLVGDENKINQCVKENELTLKGITIENATSIIDMHDEAKVVLKEKSDSSMAVGFKLLNKGKGDAFVSAGNTGAITVGATLITKRIKGIKRPAIASIMPSATVPFMLMDCGANVECRPEMLAQFGTLGSLYMHKIMGVENPRVALANNGEEETKGTPLQIEAYKIMKTKKYNFIGNIEGREIPFGEADVVVADGFTGNMILKTYEGVAKSLMGAIKNVFLKNTISKLSYLGIRGGIGELKSQFDYKEYGGAVVLGVKKPIVKAHGSSDERAFKNAIRQAKMFVEYDLIKEIEKTIKEENENEQV